MNNQWISVACFKRRNVQEHYKEDFRAQWQKGDFEVYRTQNNQDCNFAVIMEITKRGRAKNLERLRNALENATKGKLFQPDSRHREICEYEYWDKKYLETLRYGSQVGSQFLRVWTKDKTTGAKALEKFRAKTHKSGILRPTRINCGWWESSNYWFLVPVVKAQTIEESDQLAIIAAKHRRNAFGKTSLRKR